MSAPSDSAPSVRDLALLGQMFEDYRPRLLAMLRRRIDPRLATRVDAEEVLNQVFFDARRRWDAFRHQPQRSAYAWLYRLALDRLTETYRYHARSPRDLHRDLPWPEQSSVLMGLHLVNPGTSPSEAVVRGEAREQMRQALDLLKDSDRDVLCMRQVEDLSFAEIGQVLGVSENAATVRYVRALKRLKQCWQALHPEDGP